MLMLSTWTRSKWRATPGGRLTRAASTSDHFSGEPSSRRSSATEPDGTGPSDSALTLTRMTSTSSAELRPSKWLRRLSLPPEEAETVGAALRHIAFLDREIEQVERMVAKQLLTWPEAKRL